MSIEEYRPRILIDVSPELLERIRTSIPHGLRNHLYVAILEDVVSLVEERGAPVIALLISHRIKVEQISSTIKEGLNDSRGLGSEKHN